MIITTAMAAAAGMVEIQTDILDSLGGEIDTSDFVQALAAVKAGLDLMWLARMFIPDPEIVAQLRAALIAINEAVEIAKRVPIEVYDKAKLVPPLTAMFAPEFVLKESMAPIEETARAIPEAAAFVAAFTGQ